MNDDLCPYDPSQKALLLLWSGRGHEEGGLYDFHLIAFAVDELADVEGGKLLHPVSDPVFEVFNVVQLVDSAEIFLAAEADGGLVHCGRSLGDEYESEVEVAPNRHQAQYFLCLGGLESSLGD